MQSINELCDIVRQTAYGMEICIQQGPFGWGGITPFDMMPFFSAFFAFFGG